MSTHTGTLYANNLMSTHAGTLCTNTVNLRLRHAVDEPVLVALLHHRNINLRQEQRLAVWGRSEAQKHKGSRLKAILFLIRFELLLKPGGGAFKPGSSLRLLRPL